MQDQNVDILTHRDLARRVAVLEATLSDMRRRHRGQRTGATIILGAGLACLALWAQNAAGPLTVRAPFRIVGTGGQTILSVTETGTAAGKLEMKSTNGKSFTAGMTPEGIPFGRWDATNGSVAIGAPSGKFFGVRIIPAGTDVSSVSLLTTNNIASVMVGRNGVPKLAMIDSDTNLSIGILDSAGKYLSRLTSKPSGGGLEVANGTGQMVAIVDSNPTNNEGRASFYSASGTPLAKIGAAGDHGGRAAGWPEQDRRCLGDGAHGDAALAERRPSDLLTRQ